MRALVLLLVLTGSARAQPPPPTSEQEVDPVQEAIEAGYSPRPKDEPAGSLAGGLLAVFPGVALHGLGHWYVGDGPTALRLLLAEVVGVALIAGSEIMGAATNDSGELGAPRQLLTHAGGLLFVGSWVADIVGSFKGAQSFSADSTRVDSSSFGFGYRYTADPLTTARHHIVGRLNIDVGWLYARPSVDVEAGLADRRAELDLGVRVFRGQNPHNHLAVGGLVRRVETPPFGMANWGTAGYLGWKADLGQMVRSLRNLYVVNRVGAGLDWYQFASRTDAVPALLADTDFRDEYFLLHTGFELNSGRRTHLSLLVVRDPTREVAAFNPHFGLIETSLTHRYSDSLDIEVTLTAGDGWMMWLGLDYGL